MEWENGTGKLQKKAFQAAAPPRRQQMRPCQSGSGEEINTLF
ncbi:hypothetical protein [Klebsiella pneumoniae IS53]|nr:hypothetical protein [Klebsiella pneumoniae IS53]